jgi:hypothetical protein
MLPRPASRRPRAALKNDLLKRVGRFMFVAIRFMFVAIKQRSEVETRASVTGPVQSGKHVFAHGGESPKIAKKVRGSYIYQRNQGLASLQVVKDFGCGRAIPPKYLMSNRRPAESQPLPYQTRLAARIEKPRREASWHPPTIARRAFR